MSQAVLAVQVKNVKRRSNATVNGVRCPPLVAIGVGSGPRPASSLPAPNPVQSRRLRRDHSEPFRTLENLSNYRASHQDR